MKTNKFYALGTLTLVVTGVLLSGCNSSTSSPEPTTSPITTKKPNTETNTQTSELHAIIKLMGQSDSAVVEALGEGEPSLSEATKAVLTRDYTLTFLDTEVTASVAMNEAEKLSLLSIYLPDNDFSAWSSKLTSLLGEPSSTKQDNGEEANGLNEALWENDGTSISLRSVYGALIIELYKL
ncbi:hypothetical protein [Cellulosilyticum sp. WCF-2]|uniref:hypothetical protein n=1 Tax=Cellulosilyticum sp. WCF-2 TaxID=2497860 RepID=UPI000F8E0537|nr:hypothetical protein [Cellulosilyticum sp. WCF-2]QEH68176.1 hypothetical protein EKH84_07150 [Cellulosilyticum sp. WCF-2]